MKKVVSALVSVTSVGAVAVASTAAYAGGSLKDEPYAVAPFSWTGPYIGLHGGAAWSDFTVTDVDNYQGSGAGREWRANAQDGFIAGAQAGYNLQAGSLVVGVEGDIGWLGIDDGDQDPVITALGRPKNDSFARLETGFYGTITGRVGVALDQFLIYGKGGFAFVDADVSFTDTNPAGLLLVSGTKTSETLMGGVWGGGFEIALNSHWSTKLEYLHMELDDVTVRAVDNLGTTRRFKNDIDVETVKVGLNYKF